MKWVTVHGIKVPEEEMWITQQVVGQFKRSGIDIPKTVIDIGAHIGSLSAYLAKQGSERVYAYEPFRPTFKVLGMVMEQNAIAPDHVRLREVAVGDKAERRTLRAVGANSGQVGFQFAKKYPDEHDTPVRPLWKVLSEAVGFNHDIDLLKIDVEGAEYEMLYPGCRAEAFLKEYVKNVQIDIHEIHHPQFMCLEERIPEHYKELELAPELLVEYLQSIGFKDDQVDMAFTSKNHNE